MSNPEIAKHFLTLQPPAQPMLFNVNQNNVLTCLQDCFQNSWAWEIVDESVVLDGTLVSTTVMVYTPGRIFTGRSVANIKNYAENHLNAVLKAVEPLVDKKPSQNAQPTQQAPQAAPGTNMTADQIMAAVAPTQQPQQQTPATTQPQQNNPDADLPFYFGPDDPNAPPEVKAAHQAQLQAQQQAQQTPQTAQQPQQGPSIPAKYQGRPPEYYAPQDKYYGYSQYHMDRMADFKKEWAVLNDEMFLNYIQLWNPSFFKKQHLTPKNIDDFFAWTERLGKQDC